MKRSSTHTSSSKTFALRTLPGGVWALGLVSMFMDISSELIHSLLPVFMASVLGASMTTIGFIEGLAEAAAAMTKIFSGAISDHVGKRKLLAGIGYGLAALTKPIFPLATSIGWIFGARFIDRIGKGIRGAPRDALVADIAPRNLRGAAYGLRQSLDTLGAIIGPLAALVFMVWFANDIRAVLWVAVVPACIAVALLVLCVHDPERPDGEVSQVRPLNLAEAGRLPARYWLIVMLGAVFNMARFSEAFLVLRAKDVGLALGYVPLVLIAMNLFYTATAYPAGVAADKRSQGWLLRAGLAVLVAANLALAEATSPLLAFIGSALWGVHLGLTQGLFAKLVADTALTDLRGTAFGIFNLASGVALLLASLIAGELWHRFGAQATFWAGAAFAMLALLGLLAHCKQTKISRKNKPNK